MTRKCRFRIIIGCIIAWIAYCCVNTYVHHDSTIEYNTQCFQIDVPDHSKPKAVIYQPSDGHTAVWKGTCKTDVLPKASKVSWMRMHMIQTIVTSITVLAVGIGGGLYLLFLLLIAPFVALYRWAFEPIYEDDSLISIYISFIKDP